MDLALRSALGLLFLAAAVHKLRDPRRFRRIVRGYRIVPKPFVGAAAVVIPLAELVSATLLALPAGRSAGLTAVAALLLLYAGAIAVNLARGVRHIECGCGPERTRRPISGGTAARNVALAVIALAALAPVRPRVAAWVDGLGVGAVVAILARPWVAGRAGNVSGSAPVG
jgi:uncharacterized membrane protein